jgi:hypothetical protein
MMIYHPEGDTMNAQQHIMLPIPGPAEFEDDRQYLAVPASVVSAGIELLQCILSQWKLEEGLSPDKRVWDALAVSGAQMLSALMDVWAGEDHERDGEALISQMAHFCAHPHAARWLETLRGRRDMTYIGDLDVIVDALLSVHQQTGRRRSERTQLATAEQAPAQDPDPGWEF